MWFRFAIYKNAVLFFCTMALSAAGTIANIKIRYDGKTPQFAIFGTRVICVFYSIKQGLSQDLETGCLKLAVVKFLGRPYFEGGSQCTHISTINMYKFIKIRHDIMKQCHGYYKEMKKFNHKLEIEIFRNSTQKDFGVLRGSF